MIEQRLERSSLTHDPLADLVSAAPEEVLAWMRRKAALADGTQIDLPVCDAAEVLERIARARLERPVWMLPLARTNTCAWDVLQVGLARDLGACAWLEIGSRLCSSERSAMRAYRLHARALQEFDDYGRVTAAIASEAIRSSFDTQRYVHTCW
jgi:hypothetical protein